ncbi:MAG: alpha/beta hydrolase [Hyphomicrobiales bacterium]|jgi:pimeloyl-ACP methyl ester carboxylesterase|nr:alpha/beta hydrolase [Hyphomicrobiales bacterium]
MLLTTLGLAGALAAGGWTATGFVSADAESRHPPGGRFVALPNGRLHLVDTGMPHRGAPTILLIHGASSHHADLFSVFAPRLRDKARVIAVDRPGHGWSDRLGGREMADPARQAGAIITALGEIGVRRATIIGHSLAGAVSTRMALDRPDLVSGLVLLGAVTHPWPGRTITWYYHPASRPVLGALFSRLVAIPAGSLLLESSIAGVFQPQPAPRDYARTAQTRLVLRPASFEANALDVKVMYDFVDAQWPRYRELAMPVLAIAGDRDTIVWTDIHSRAIAAEARDGRLIVLPGVGHMPHHGVPDLIAREALAIAAG